jgi:hypothetical protein
LIYKSEVLLESTEAEEKRVYPPSAVIPKIHGIYFSVLRIATIACLIFVISVWSICIVLHVDLQGGHVNFYILLHVTYFIKA